MISKKFDRIYHIISLSVAKGLVVGVGGFRRRLQQYVLCFNSAFHDPSASFLGTVSAPASVGASKLRLEVATGNPHPYKQWRYWSEKICYRTLRIAQGDNSDGRLQISGRRKPPTPYNVILRSKATKNL